MIDAGPEQRGTTGALAEANGSPAAARLSMLHCASAFLENAPAPVAIIDRLGYRVLYVNAAFRRAHPLATSQMELSIASVFDIAAARALEALVDNGSVVGLAVQDSVIALHEGEERQHCSAWPLVDEHGSGPPMVMIEMRAETSPVVEAERALHITVAQRLVLSALHDQMLAEASGAAAKVAEAANAAKDKFLTTMSHELRTPLNAIGGYAELIELGLRGPVTPAQRDDLGRIQRAQVHLLGLINSVLNFSKLKEGRVSFEIEPVRLDSTLDAVLEMLLPQLTKKGLTFERTVHAGSQCESLRVRADPEKLRQILINLLSNAIKFTDAGGAISTRCDVRDGNAFVQVRDTGRGISEQDLAQVFDPFVQVGRRLSSNDPGVGLGLSISRDLARGMGGDLTATSTVDVGSTFELTLPCASTSALPSP